MAQRRRKRPSYKRNNKNSRKKLLASIIIAITAIAGAYNYRTELKSAVSDVLSPMEYAVNEDSSDKLTLVKSPDTMPGQLVEYKGFTVSFNPELRIPNYVAYELTRGETGGDVARAGSFDRDTDVEGCPEPSDYTRSGYDRGHMAPAADMKWDYDAMHASFYMTNICPQNHSLNSGGWKRLEEKIRDWAERDSALVVITGPIVEPGHDRLKSGVAVPQKFFKAVLSPYTKPIRGIAFIYKNAGGQKVIERQMVSIDSVESATGLDLFYELPDEIEDRIEKSSDYNEWNN